MDKFRNRKEFAAILGIDERTLRDKLKDAQIELPKGLISPKDQQMIKDFFGFKE
jgi:hypothetical protein